MKPPIAPSQEDCCNSGCNPCIFDVYERQLKLYEKFLKSGESENSKENGISDVNYTTFELVAKVITCNNHAVLAFKTLKPDIKVWWKPGAHFLFKYNNNETVCTRAYTPIILSDVVNTYFDFMIIVKNCVNGFVSSYLYSLDIGQHTLWRGPYGSYEVIPNKYNRIIMVAQGTGIAPFFSIISKILDDEDDMTKIFLFFCCHSLSTVLLRDELYAFKSYWNFSYKLFVSDDVPEESSLKYEEPMINHKLNYDDFDSLGLLTAGDQFLLCGSAQFMQHFKLFLLENYVHSENIVLF